MYCQVSGLYFGAPHRGQAMRGGQHRVRREFDCWFGPNVEVLSLVPTKVFVVCTSFSPGCTGLLRTTFQHQGFAGH